MGGAISLRRFSSARPMFNQGSSPGEESVAEDLPKDGGQAVFVSPVIEEPSSPIASRPALLSRKSSNSLSLRTRTLEKLEESAESMVEALSESNLLVSLLHFLEHSS